MYGSTSSDCTASVGASRYDVGGFTDADPSGLESDERPSTAAGAGSGAATSRPLPCGGQQPSAAAAATAAAAAAATGAAAGLLQLSPDAVLLAPRSCSSEGSSGSSSTSSSPSGGPSFVRVVHSPDAHSGDGDRGGRGSTAAMAADGGDARPDVLRQGGIGGTGAGAGAEPAATPSPAAPSSGRASTAAITSPTGSAVPLAAAAALLPPSQYQRYFARMYEAHAEAMAELAGAAAGDAAASASATTDDGAGCGGGGKSNAAHLQSSSDANEVRQAAAAGGSVHTSLPPLPPPPPPRPHSISPGGTGRQRAHGPTGPCWTSLDEWRQRNLLEIEATEGLVTGHLTSPQPYANRQHWHTAGVLPLAVSPPPPPCGPDTSRHVGSTVRVNSFWPAAAGGAAASAFQAQSPPLRVPASPPDGGGGGSGLSPAGRMLYRFLSQRAAAVGGGGGDAGGKTMDRCEGGGGGGGDMHSPTANPFASSPSAAAAAAAAAFDGADGAAVVARSLHTGGGGGVGGGVAVQNEDSWPGHAYAANGMYDIFDADKYASMTAVKPNEDIDMTALSYMPYLGVREGQFDIPQGPRFGAQYGNAAASGGGWPALDGTPPTAYPRLYGSHGAFMPSPVLHPPASPPLYGGSAGRVGDGSRIGGVGGCTRLESLYGRLVALSCDQQGSRVVQRLLCTAHSEQVGRCLDELLPSIMDVACHPYGNYVLQQLMTVGGARHKLRLCGALAGRILELSFDPYGCRVVQKLLEVVPEHQAAAAVAELDGAVMRCVRDKCAHHVLRAALHHVPHHRQRFLLDGLQAALPSLARHPYGCRLVQSLLQTVCEAERWKAISSDLLQDAPQLGGHEYGNYVMQTLAQVAAPAVRSALAVALAPHAVRLACCRHGSPVLEAVLKYGNDTDREVLLTVLLGPSSGGALAAGGGGSAVPGRTARTLASSGDGSDGYGMQWQYGYLGGGVGANAAATGGSGGSGGATRALRLACDPFGNYVLQRCFQVCNLAQQARVAAALLPTIPELTARCAASHHPGMAALLARLQEITADPSMLLQAEPLPPRPPPPPPPAPQRNGAVAVTTTVGATAAVSAEAAVRPLLAATSAKAQPATSSAWQYPANGGAPGGVSDTGNSPRSMLRAALGVHSASFGSSSSTSLACPVGSDSAASSTGGSGTQMAAAVAAVAAVHATAGTRLTASEEKMSPASAANLTPAGKRSDADAVTAAAAVAMAAAARALSLDEWALLAAVRGDDAVHGGCTVEGADTADGSALDCATAASATNNGSGSESQFRSPMGQSAPASDLHTAQHLSTCEPLLPELQLQQLQQQEQQQQLPSGCEGPRNEGASEAKCAASTDGMAGVSAAALELGSREHDVAAGRRLLLRTLSRVASGSSGGAGGGAASADAATEDAVLSDESVMAVLRVLGLAPVGSGRSPQQ